MSENLTKHSTWSGVAIHVGTDGYFYTKVEDIEIREERLATVRERIDRALKPTAKKQKIALSVIVITDDKATPTTLTGVSRTNRAMEFSPAVKTSRYGNKILADTPSNRVLAETLLAARHALDDAQDAVNRRSLDVRGYGRVEIEEYQGIIDALVAAHKTSGSVK